MAAAMQKESVWLNPEVLKWARERRGRTIEEAAKKIRKLPADILRWENGDDQPTINQARELADFYARPFLEFLYSSPPVLAEPVTIPDFRLDRRDDGSVDPWMLEDVLRWASAQRLNAIDLYHELNESPTLIPEVLFAGLSDNPGLIAARFREFLSFSIDDQFSMSKRETSSLAGVLREMFESTGILTLRDPSLRRMGIRGICLADYPLPVIVIASEANTAQSFTLAHELAHVLLRQSGVTGLRARAYELIPVEKWCDRFAAEFLMPTDAIVRVFSARPSRPAPSIDDATLQTLAEQFHVSPHAMLVRLVQLEFVESAYYWETKKAEFDVQDAQARGFGRAKYYGVRFRSRLGDLYTGLVIEAWARGRITNHNAAELMGIKNLDHLNDIRDHFGVS